jgi:hypothetical protein
MATADTLQELEHYYKFGDMYQALEACDQLEVMLARLKRQQLLPNSQCEESRNELAHIRERLENHISSASLMPKGPNLP